MRGSARSTSLRKVSTETRLRRTMPGSQGRRPPNSICSPKISTGVPTIPAIPGGAGTQFGRLNRIRTKPKARSPKASTISPMETVSPLARSTTCRSTAEALPWPAPAGPSIGAATGFSFTSVSTLIPLSQPPGVSAATQIRGEPMWRTKGSSFSPEARPGLFELRPEPEGGDAAGKARGVVGLDGEAGEAPSPRAGSIRAPGVFSRKRRIGSSFSMPMTES